MYLLFSFTVGGTEKLVTDICNEISKENEVYLYIINQNYDNELLKSISDRVHIKRYNRIAGSSNKVKAILDLSKYIRGNKIDVVHCNALDTPEMLLFKPFFFRKTRIVYTIHGMDQYDKLSKWKRIYRNLLCNKIIAISKAVEADIVNAGADQRKVQVVYNAINIEKFKQQVPKKIDDKEVILGNVARIDCQIKGQDLLIRAIALLKEKQIPVRCCFAGEADSYHQDDMKELKKLVKENGLENNIEFCGTVTDIPKFLKGIDLFVLPSRFEGFGISLIEAMAAGIPCISSDIDGPKEIIGDEERGSLFISGDPVSLAEAIERAVINYTEQKEKAKIAEEYVKQQFDIRNMCKSLMKIYQNE